MVALPKPRPLNPTQQKFQDDIERELGLAMDSDMADALAGRIPVLPGDTGFGSLSKRAEEARQKATGFAVGIPAGLAGLPADIIGLPSAIGEILAKITGQDPRAAYLELSKMDKGERDANLMSMTDSPQEFAALSGFFDSREEGDDVLPLNLPAEIGKRFGAEAVARGMGFEEELDEPGFTPFRQGMLAGELVADPALIAGGISKLLKAVRRTPDLGPGEVLPPTTRQEPTIDLGTPPAAEPEIIEGTVDEGIQTLLPAPRTPDLVPPEVAQQPTRLQATGDIVDEPTTTVPEMGEVDLDDLPRSEVTGLPVLRTEVTERMATPEETAAFLRGEDPAQYAPGTAPEAEEAAELFDAAAEARAIEPRPGEGAQERGILQFAPPQNESANQYGSFHIPIADRRSQNNVSQNQKLQGVFGSKSNSFSPIRTFIEAKAERNKFNQIRTAGQLDKKFSQGQFKDEYINSKLQRILNQDPNKTFTPNELIELVDENIPQPMVRTLLASTYKSEYDAGRVPSEVDRSGTGPGSYVFTLDRNGDIDSLSSMQVDSRISGAADDAGVMIFSADKLNDTIALDGSTIGPMTMKEVNHSYGFTEFPNFYGHLRFSMVTGADGKRYLVVNEIQSDPIRQFEAGIAGEKTIEMGDIRDLATDQILETDVATPEVGTPEYRKFKEDLEAEGKVFTRIKNKTSVVREKDLAERLRKYFEVMNAPNLNRNFTDQISGATSTTYGRSGAMRIPLTNEVLDLIDEYDVLFPKEVSKHNKATDSLEEAYEEIEELETSPLNTDSVMFASETPFAWMLPEEGEALTRLNVSNVSPKMKRVWDGRHQVRKLLDASDGTEGYPAPQPGAFERLEEAVENGITGNTISDEDFNETVREFTEFADDPETFYMDLAAEAGSPIGTDTAKLLANGYKNIIPFVIPKILDSHVPGVTNIRKVFQEKLADRLGYGDFGVIDNIATSSMINGLMKESQEIKDFFMNANQQDIDLMSGADSAAKEERIKELLDNVPEETRNKIKDLAKTDVKRFLKEVYGRNEEQATKKISDIDFVFNEGQTLVGYRSAFRKIGGNDHRRFLNYLAKKEKYAEQVDRLSPDILLPSVVTQKMNEFNALLDSMGERGEMIRAIQNVIADSGQKSVSMSGSEADIPIGFMPAPPHKTEESFTQYAVRSVIDEAMDMPDVDGVVFLDPSTYFGSRGVSPERYTKLYGSAVDKVLNQLDGVTPDITVQRGVTDLSFIEPGNPMSLSGGFTDIAPLRVIRFGEDIDKDFVIRRAKGGEVDLRPKKMIHSGIGAMAREMM